MKSRYPCQEPSTITSSANTHTSHFNVLLRWKPTRRKHRRWLLLFTFCCLVIFSLVFRLRLRTSESPHANQWILLHERGLHPSVEKHVPFWRSLHNSMHNNNPQCRKRPDLVVPQKADIPFDPLHSHPRPDLLWLDDADIVRLRAAHTNFVSDIHLLTSSLVYEPRTRGIVTIATESLLVTLAISLRMLRRTSSTLPVEIFLRTPSSRSRAYCSNVFPLLNAECFYLSDVFTAAATPYAPTMHQAKILSILFSTFEDVLFLDPCAFPLTAPDALFHTVPFIDTGLTLWPDFWYASESPYFFDIAKILDAPSLDERPATDSGEMMYSKSKHAASLMLAAYYNFYGPDYYYLLQSQGGPGAGEKETFGSAAMALKEPFHHVQHNVHSLGRHDGKGNWIGTGMIQFDPIADFYTQDRNRVPVIQPEDIVHTKSESRRRINVKPMFVRVDFPKFDPQSLFREGAYPVNSATVDNLGNMVRSWMNEKEAIKTFGFDLENQYWRAIQDAVCGDLLGLWVEEGVPDKRALELVKRRDTQLCEKVQNYYIEVFGAVKQDTAQRSLSASAA